MREVPVGWLEEYSKVENTVRVASMQHVLDCKSWPVKFRLINRDTVLPGQTLLFMRDETLKKKKLEVYVLLKILKYCTGSSAKSYQCKFAIEQAITNQNIESIDMVGPALKKIIHLTLRGKFSSVHPDMAAEGITKVEVGDEGLHFIRRRMGGFSVNLKTNT